MPAKREVPNADDLVARYIAGKMTGQLCKEAGISACCFERLLRERGLKFRSIQEAARLRRGQPVPRRQWKPEDPDKLLKEYSDGASVNALATRYGVSRQAINGFLLRHGLTPRGQSEAEQIKWAAMKRDRAAVERQCSAAWRAADAKDDALCADVKRLYVDCGLPISEVCGMLGITRTNGKRILRKLGISDPSRERVAQGFAASAGKPIAGKFELDVIAALRRLGYEAIHQMAFGACNVDIALPERRVAVEIERRSLCKSKSIRRERLEHVFNRGWRLMIVYAYADRRKKRFDVEAVAQAIHAFAQLRSGNEPVFGEYGMVRGDGKPSAGRSPELDGWTRVAHF